MGQNLPEARFYLRLAARKNPSGHKEKKSSAICQGRFI
jgi:hypothetical protein